MDTSSFRFLLAQRLDAPVSSTNAWVIGELGDSSIPVWSAVNVAGIRLHEINPSIGQSNDTESRSNIHQEVVNAGSEIVRLKGFSASGIALSCVDIASVILGTGSDVKTVSTFVKGLYGINKEVFLSLPCVLDRNGISSIVNIKLSDSERKKLHASVNILDEIQKGISF